MKHTLEFARVRNKDGVLNPETDRYEYDLNQDLWRVNWKVFGFAYCTVYLITPKSGWPTKIGIAEFPAARMLTLQTAHWNELIVARSWICEDRASALKVEKASHKVIQHLGKHLLGEWFDMRKDEAADVVTRVGGKLGVELAERLPPTEKFAPVFAELETDRKLRDRASIGHLNNVLFDRDVRGRKTGASK